MLCGIAKYHCQMSTHRICILTLLIAFAHTPARTQVDTPVVELWHAGFMHANEIKGKEGQLWYGLYESESGFSLERTSIRIIDTSGTMESDKYVAVDQPGLPIFLVRGLPNVEPGPVKTVFSGRLRLQPDQSVLLVQKKAYFEGLFVTGTKQGEIIHDYEMVLYDSTVRQPIFECDPAYGDGQLALIWAGDVDRDGRIDLLIDLSNGYNASEPTLFLSSMAKEGELARKVASYLSIGC